MKPQDRKRFLGVMAKARVALPGGSSLTDDEKAIRTDVFWDILSVYPIERVEKAFRRAMGELKFFPAPSEIIGFISEDYESEYQKKQIEWSEPPEDVKRKVLKLLSELKDRWKEEEAVKEKKRAELFEAKRKELKQQTRLLK